MQAETPQATSSVLQSQDARQGYIVPSKQDVRGPFRKNLTYAGGALLLAAALIAQTAFGAIFAVPTTAPTDSHVAQALPSSGAPLPQQYFAVTGKTVSGAFLSSFNRFGLASIGYPLSDERQEGGRTVQYFERVRMEYHPENAGSSYAVLMTLLGADLSQRQQPFAAVAPFASTQAAAYIAQTHHSLSGVFLSYWKSKGGVDLFGYPISEPMQQDGLRVQWFERARFEYHPELEKTGQPVQLTLLGRTAFEQTAPPVQPSAQNPAPKAEQAAQVVQKQQKPAGVTLNAMEQYLLTSINSQRASAGLGAVTLDQTVTDVARSRSSDMATRNYFSHTTPDGKQFFSMLTDRGASYKYAGEILARNNYPDDQAAQIAMTSYLNSAPHKAIMMDGRYNTIGVGYAKSSDGMQYYTVLFVQH